LKINIKSLEKMQNRGCNLWGCHCSGIWVNWILQCVSSLSKGKSPMTDVQKSKWTLPFSHLPTMNSGHPWTHFSVVFGADWGWLDQSELLRDVSCTKMSSCLQTATGLTSWTSSNISPTSFSQFILLVFHTKTQVQQLFL